MTDRDEKDCPEGREGCRETRERRTSTVGARRPCRTPTKIFCGVVFPRRPKITKVIFRPCGLSASLRHHEFLAR